MIKKLDKKQQEWVEETFSELTLDEKIETVTSDPV